MQSHLTIYYLIEYISESKIYKLQRYAKASGQLLDNKVAKTYEKLQYKKPVKIIETSLESHKYDVTAR